MNQFSRVETEPLRVRLRAEHFMFLDAHGAFADYGRVELLEGELLYMNAQYRPHMVAKDELAYRLRRAIEAAGIALFVGTEGSVRLSDIDVPQPDIVLTSEPGGTGPIPGASVTLLVEVADSTLDHDLGRKAMMYAHASIPEYWVVDLNARVIHQLSTPAPSGFEQQVQIPFGDPITSVAVSGLTVATDRL